MRYAYFAYRTMIMNVAVTTMVVPAKETMNFQYKTSNNA